jgi:hypothetical protein
MNGGYWQEQERRREEERQNAPQRCPHCDTPINQQLGRWDKPRRHCGADRCRKALSRAGIAERKRQERSRARNRMLQYCNDHLNGEQRHAVMDAVDLLMAFNYDEGHEIAEKVIQVMENKRCKHDRIAQLEQNALLWQRRAQASERQLKERIAELEAELELFNGLQATIHGIAQNQQQKQPDPPTQFLVPAPEPPSQQELDHAQVLETLKKAGIQSVEEYLAEQRDGEEDEDDTERGNYEEYDEEEE